MKTTLIVTGLLFSIGAFTGCYIKSVTLNQNCTGYLERAANANSVETAREQLTKATAYAESNNLTSGYTSVFYNTPDEDISFWYKNLKQSEEELLKVDSATTSLERSNILIKLRETLMSNGGKYGDQVTYPDGLSRYPSNALWGILLFFAIIVFILIIGYLCLPDL